MKPKRSESRCTGIQIEICESWLMIKTLRWKIRRNSMRRGKPRPPNTVTSHCSSKYGALVLTGLWRSGLTLSLPGYARNSFRPRECPLHATGLTTWRRSLMSMWRTELCRTGSFGLYPFFSAAKQNKNESNSVMKRMCFTQDMAKITCPCVWLCGSGRPPLPQSVMKSLPIQVTHVALGVHGRSELLK